MAATTTLIGNITHDFELRYTQNGRPVGSVTIAVNDRKFDKQKNEYVETEPWFARCTVWGEMAEQAAQSLTKGTRVIGHGRISERAFEDKDGNKRKAVEVILDEVGPSLRYATAQVTRTSGGGAGRSSSPQQASAEPWGQPQPAAPQQDVWGAPDTTYQTETPF